MATLLRDSRLGYGIGGAHAVFDIAGVTVFAKSVPLTEQERRSAQSTANVFGLPTTCNYGMGSPSSNVWREVAAREQTTDWVLQGSHESFPLRYHWRVVPGSNYEVQQEHADVEAAVALPR